MPDPFDAYQYFSYLRARWRLAAATLAAALAVSLTASLLLPKEYTARVALVIDPPAAADPRATTAINPIYLESLRTYERFASSDHLFGLAVERFGLRGGWRRRTLEAIKRDVLKVEIPRNTKILDISVTLRDPQKAHAAALYIADETIKLNRQINRAADEELIAEARKALEEAERRLREAEAARSRFLRREPAPEGLKAELEELRSLRDEVSRLALSADLTAAERGRGSEPADQVKSQAAGSRAERLRREAADLDRRIAAKQTLLAGGTAEAQRLEAEYDSAWTARDLAEKRLREVQSTAGYRGERLNLMDPGVAPEKPSFPNLPLNLVVAAALALIGSLIYLTVEFNLASQKSEMLLRSLRVASKT